MALLDDYRQFLELTDHYIIVLRRLLFDAAPDRILEVMTADCKDFGEKGAFLLVFDVEGIRAAGFPDLFKLSRSRPATVTLFLDSIDRWLTNRLDGDSSRQVEQWRKRTSDEIESDPRYTAFRTSHDWIILHASLLAECGLEQAAVAELEQKSRGLIVDVGSNWPGGASEPAWITGDPRTLFHRRALGPFAPEFAARGWSSVADKFRALSSFHKHGYHSYRQVTDDGPWQMDAVEFWMHVSRWGGPFADVIKRNWTGRPTDDLIADPRYQALKIAWDRHAARVYSAKLRLRDQLYVVSHQKT